MEQLQPTKPKRSAKKWADLSRGEKTAGIAALIFVGLVVLWGISAATSNTSSTQPTAVSNSNNQQTTQSQPTQPTTAQQVTAWQSKHGSIFTTLSNDMSKIGTDGQNTDASAMNTDCKQLQTDVATAQGLPAIPDAQTASDWSSGLTYLADAAPNCIDGTANSDASLVTKAATEISQANTKILATAADIKALANQ